MTTDRPAQPYRIAERIDLSGMKPATRGTNRSCPANYLGGRLHGVIPPAGWHALRRDESGKDLDDTTARELPSHYYRLFVDDNGFLWHYVHSSLLPDPE